MISESATHNEEPLVVLFPNEIG